MKVKTRSFYRFLGLLILLGAVIFAYFYWHRISPPWMKRVLEQTEDGQSPPVFLAHVNGPKNYPLNGPLGVAVNGEGWIYVVDSGNSKVKVFDPQGRFLFQFGRFGQKAGEFDYPTSITIDGDGQVYVGDFNNARIQVFTPKGLLVRTISKETAGVPVVPLDLTMDGRGRLYVANRDGKVLILTPEGKLLKEFGRAGSLDGYLSYPNGIRVDRRGVIYVSDSGNGRLQVFDQEGRLVRKLESPKYLFSLPAGLAIDHRGRLYVVDTLTHSIAVFDQQLNPLFTFGVRGLNEGELNFPSGIAIDNLGKIYITDRENNRVAIFGYPRRPLY